MKRPADWTKDPQYAAVRIPNVDLRAMDLFWPQSTGAGFSASMRLVALLLLVWDHHGEQEVYWDHDQIADRTGLPVSVVSTALEQLRQVHLVEETAAGPRLTWASWDAKTRQQWLDAGYLRPRRPVGSPQQSTTNQKEPHGNDQVAT